jgi:hypothetical protein
MSELEMKGVVLVPFKIGYSHAPPLSSVIHSMTYFFQKIKGNYLVPTTSIHGINSKNRMIG